LTLCGLRFIADEVIADTIFVEVFASAVAVAIFWDRLFMNVVC